MSDRPYDSLDAAKLEFARELTVLKNAIGAVEETAKATDAKVNAVRTTIDNHVQAAKDFRKLLTIALPSAIAASAVIIAALLNYRATVEATKNRAQAAGVASSAVQEVIPSTRNLVLEAERRGQQQEYDRQQQWLIDHPLPIFPQTTVASKKKPQ